MQPMCHGFRGLRYQGVMVLMHFLGTPWNTLGRLGHLGTPWNTLERLGTPWDALERLCQDLLILMTTDYWITDYCISDY